jgi:geranylgeranyl diphosphate synthase type II
MHHDLLCVYGVYRVLIMNPLALAPREEGKVENRAAPRIERALEAVLDRAATSRSPPRLREAIAYAVFPGGSRLRPSLCLAAATACGELDRARADAAAAAVELVHCASLVHDDLPCFDDAKTRRGRATLHVRFDEPTAVLVGDALLVLAFETLARAGALAELALLTASTGPARGIIAGQAWESERAVPLDEYHRAKTAALFAAAAGMGAMSAGADPRPWRAFGEIVGRAYQAADDVADATSSELATGKTTGRDAALGRPSLARSRGVGEARRRVAALVEQARSSIPRCREAAAVEAWMDALAGKLRSAT